MRKAYLAKKISKVFLKKSIARPASKRPIKVSNFFEGGIGHLVVIFIIYTKLKSIQNRVSVVLYRVDKTLVFVTLKRPHFNSQNPINGFRSFC